MFLIWGHDTDEISKIQKRDIRIIRNKHFLCHTEPLFKLSKILKVCDLHKLQEIKLCRKYVTGQLPNYYSNIELKRNSDMHHYDTIHKNLFLSSKPCTEIGRKIIKNRLPIRINSLSSSLYETLYDTSDRTVTNLFKQQTLNAYTDQIRCPPNATCWPCSVIPVS